MNLLHIFYDLAGCTSFLVLYGIFVELVDVTYRFDTIPV